jgi:hypothetical protein
MKYLMAQQIYDLAAHEVSMRLGSLGMLSSVTWVRMLTYPGQWQHAETETDS